MQVAGVIRFKFVYNNRLGYNSDFIILDFNVGYKGDGIIEDIINYLIINKLLIYSLYIIIKLSYLRIV